MFSKIQDFFTALQKKDDLIKKRWLIFFTASSMLVVITLWSFYLSATIRSFNSEPQQAVAPGASETFRNGLVIVSSKIMAELRDWRSAVMSFIGQTNSVTIQGASLNFVTQSTEDIKPRTLP
ncbi:MAG: hypothetical protein A3H63_02390 [Candidatus Harrisonbacteria bacterium RIFCSPLOWO2_02_FULL_45_10c]|uniref:Uncharacterized protein n=1 Tax=Candidatus Harrisonbacteria bacterium RIFCSPLOWO2_02_FULL_45_10c TaxID=1798410 RepID=A0A1G1ZQF9_9BACT|nr:MAG: hypothetical protein A3H63_02390 [Candidatus Harrisonbacteria bacterium RIFCSPLOWO2_02_FULL_45_10c]